MTNLVLKSARVIDPAAGRDEIADIIIRDGVIFNAGASAEGLTVINAIGLLAAPGLWDVHVHFRDPGHPAAETRRSGAAVSPVQRLGGLPAAARGAEQAGLALSR